MSDKKNIKDFLDKIFPKPDLEKCTIKTVSGRIYDINDESVLSFRNKHYLLCVNEFRIPSIRPFIEYLISGEILNSVWNRGGYGGGYGELGFQTRDGERVELSGNHGVSEIIEGIRDEKFDVSEVLHDLAVLYRGSGSEPKEERKEFYEKIRDIIKNGLTVDVLVEEE